MPITVNIAASYGLAFMASRAIHEIDEPFEYFEDFLGTLWMEKAANPERKTLLHSFLESYRDFLWDEELHVVNPSGIFPELLHALQVAGIKQPVWFTKEKIDKNLDKLSLVIKRIRDVEVHASFQLLFQDKEFLHQFHLHVKKALERGLKNVQFQNEEGKILRCDYIPSWLKRAVFFRDQGRCQNCHKDVSGLLTLENRLHLDHLLPLHQGGSNDSTNFQLLCEQCNLKKGGKAYNPKNRIAAYWPTEQEG